MPFAEEADGFVALVTLREGRVRGWANEHGVPYARYRELVERPELREQVWMQLEAVNRELPAAERVRRMGVVPEAFTREAGLRGPHGELRRAAVAARYEALLASLTGSPPATRTGPAAG